MRSMMDCKQRQPHCSLLSTASTSRRIGHSHSTTIEAPDVRGMPDKCVVLLRLRAHMAEDDLTPDGATDCLDG